MGTKPPWTPVGEAGPKTGPWTPGTPPPASLAPQALPCTWYVEVPTQGLHRGLSGGCELLPRTPSTEAMCQEPSPDEARPAAQESMGNAGLGQLRAHPDPGLHVQHTGVRDNTQHCGCAACPSASTSQEPKRSLGHSECA